MSTYLESKVCFGSFPLLGVGVEEEMMNYLGISGIAMKWKLPLDACLNPINEVALELN